MKAYLRGHWHGVGHNPLGALSVIALLPLMAGQALAGASAVCPRSALVVKQAFSARSPSQCSSTANSPRYWRRATGRNRSISTSPSGRSTSVRFRQAGPSW